MIWAPLKKKNKPQARFCYMRIHPPKRLKSTKTGISSRLKPWFAQKPQFWFIFDRKMLIYRKSLIKMVRNFGLKISTSPRLLVVSMSQILSHLLRPSGWLWHLKRSLVSLSLTRTPTQKNDIGMVVKLYITQQLTSLMTFFQIRLV